MSVKYSHPRGTKAALDTLAASNSLVVGQVYFLTDENKLVIATSTSTYISFNNQSDVQTALDLKSGLASDNNFIGYNSFQGGFEILGGAGGNAYFSIMGVGDTDKWAAIEFYNGTEGWENQLGFLGSRGSGFEVEAVGMALRLLGPSVSVEANTSITGTLAVSGDQTIGGSISASNLSGTNTGDQTVASLGLARGIGFHCAGVPSANEVIGGMISPYAFTITQANCTVKALVAATASTTITIKKNGTQIGTAVFSAAGTTATVTITSPAIIAGDQITFHAPATPDATLADIDGLVRE